MEERLKQTLVLGREHYSKREFDQAEPMLREVLDHSDRFADVHDMLGVIAHARGNFIAAERHFERALALNPSYTEAALNLAVTYNDRGKYDAARDVYARIKGRPSGSLQVLDSFARGKLANMHADIAQAYADAGLPREAIGEYEKAVALCPQFADLRTKLGTLLRQTNEPAKAKEQYEAALEARPSYVPARILLGVTLLSLGELEAAEGQWKTALEADPENTSAKMYLRMLTSQRTKGSQPPPPAAPLAPPPAPPRPSRSPEGPAAGARRSYVNGVSTKATWRAKLREAWARLRGGSLTPWRAALSVAVGLAIGVTPLYGLHLVIVLAICVPLRLDAPVAYLAANVSMPLLAPFLSLAEIEIGAWVQRGHTLPLNVETVRAHGVAAFARELVVGTLIFSPAIALLGGAVTFVLTSLVKRGAVTAEPASPEAAPPLTADVEAGRAAAFARVAARYAHGRKAAYHYVRSKLAGDPVAGAVAAIAPLGEVSDIGCGRGQLAVFLLEVGAASSVAGFDWDAAKVDDARRAAAGLRASFSVGDVRAAAVQECDTALLIDVLHYLKATEQDDLLTRAAARARARVVVRELDPDRGWRSRVTRMQEAITTSLRFNRGARVRPRPIAELASVLEASGFEVHVTPCWGKTPFANVLLVAARHARTRDDVSSEGTHGRTDLG